MDGMKKFNVIMKDAVLNDIPHFSCREDAKTALDWIESYSVMN